ncbi:hypothetical protein A374_09149 [Fictibacillus macauensis ZFHKF-1]|uniref:YitT family protein n=1 Tax=Fictibacillus macauensis ZFHKF-1 TaxID=1196324 RepID=I8J2M8_9BACL|nr:YitT family protein [Fictibacillus macauensis]EIT85991.1 hypothetical protein A374_09149 [Fictibacillus macauensis ZFHKF-1]
MIVKILAITTGSFLMAVGINVFILPFHLLDGGILGIGLLFQYAFGINVGATIVLLSLPIYLYAWKYERYFFINGIHGMLISSLFIDLLFPLKGLFHLPVLESAILGGLFIGTGIGIMLRQKASTGGTDLLALFIARKASLNVGIIIFVMDCLVIGTGVYVTGPSLFMYSMVTILSVALATSTITFFHSVKVYLNS